MTKLIGCRNSACRLPVLRRGTAQSPVRPPLQYVSRLRIATPRLLDARGTCSGSISYVRNMNCDDCQKQETAFHRKQQYKVSLPAVSFGENKTPVVGWRPIDYARFAVASTLRCPHLYYRTCLISSFTLVITFAGNGAYESSGVI